MSIEKFKVTTCRVTNSTIVSDTQLEKWGYE